MEFKDIKTWIVTAEHKARPKNNYPSEDRCKPLNEYNPYWAFESFAAQHTYATDESLPPGEYPAELFDSPVWQFRKWDKEVDNWGEWMDATKIYCSSLFNMENSARLFLPIKNTLNSIHGTKTSYQILDDAIAFATLEIKDNDYENVIEAMENYASQFKQPANNESLEKKALKYANDFVFPIKGVEYGYSYLQELKAQRDLIKDAYMAGAANNDAVKVIEERIKELEATPTGWQDSERIILIEELKHILKLIQ